MFAHLYTHSLSIIAERISFDTGIKWIYSGYIFSFTKMRRPTIHLFLSWMKGKSLLCSNIRFIYSDCKKICFQPNISFRAKGEEFDFTFPACLYACNSKVYRFPLKHNAENRKKTTIRISLLIEQQIHLQATIKASILFHQSQKTNWLFMDEFPRHIITIHVYGNTQRWRHCCFPLTL